MGIDVGIFSNEQNKLRSEMGLRMQLKKSFENAAFAIASAKPLRVDSDAKRMTHV